MYLPSIAAEQKAMNVAVCQTDIKQIFHAVKHIGYNLQAYQDNQVYKQQQQQARAEGKKIVRDVVVPETITVQELANRMAERGVELIKHLMKDGEMHKITDVIDADTAELIAEEFGKLTYGPGA